MSDTTTVETPAAEPHGNPAPTAPVTPAAPAAEVDYKAKYEETLAHSRTWEQRAKENKAAADELQQFKDAQKTAEEKQAEKVAALERENAAFKAEKQRAEWAKEISAETNVPAEVLRGSTREEIEAHAELLKSAFATPATPAAPAVPTIGVQPTSGNVSLNDQIAAAEAAGNTALVAALKAQKLGAIS